MNKFILIPLIYYLFLSNPKIDHFDTPYLSSITFEQRSHQAFPFLNDSYSLNKKNKSDTEICSIVYPRDQKIIQHDNNISPYYLKIASDEINSIKLYDYKEQRRSDKATQFLGDSTDANHFDFYVYKAVSQALCFYKIIFRRNGLDNKGSTIDCYLNDPIIPNNAIWDGKVMRFGKQASSGKCMASIDIIGHELTHAITFYTSHLHSGGESGAISESISDIMGKSIEFWVNKNNFSWIISEQMNYPVRDMSNPNLFHQPSTYKDSVYWYRGSIDEKNDHINSGIGNYMFYLLAHGGSGVNANGKHYIVRGIGILAADTIIYRTETVYLKTYSLYCDWREACEMAAKDSYGNNSFQLRQVINAWDAVGVPECRELFK